MARFIRKVQSSNSAQKYLFELQVHDVQLQVPYEVQVFVTFKCGTKRQVTKGSPTINAGVHVAPFDGEKLTLLSSLARDKDTQELQERFVCFLVLTLRVGSSHCQLEARRKGEECGGC